MMHSQFLELYLDGNDQRAREGDLPITIGTFLSQILHGKAKSYGGKYGQALKRSCIAVGALEVETKGGGRGYIRIKDTIPVVEALAQEFFNCRQANFAAGTKGASLWISDPQRGHYIDAKDAARFYAWATGGIIGIRSLGKLPELIIGQLVIAYKPEAK
ncbi:MAG TPA: hypothetical protein VF772_04545 [Terriglobales bacterium]